MPWCHKSSGHGVKELKEKVQISCQRIRCKVMQKASKIGCSLDTISIAEFCFQGVKLKWCAFFLMSYWQLARMHTHQEIIYVWLPIA